MGAEVHIAGMQAVFAPHRHERGHQGQLIQQSTKDGEIARFSEKARARTDRVRVYSGHMHRRRPNMHSGTVGISFES
jgi:hypothetical protein